MYIYLIEKEIILNKSMNNENNWVIKCPHCGAEYVLCEIFYPEDLVKQTKELIKDEEGKIIFIRDDITPETIESYICDHCDKAFKIKAKISIEYLEDDFADDDF